MNFVSHGLAVANTFFEHDPDHQVTCYNVGSRPSDPLLPRHFGQIDLLRCPRSLLWSVVGVESRREAALSSHHFLVL